MSESESSAQQWHQFLLRDGLGLAFRVIDRDNRLTITDVYIYSPDGVGARELAQVPLARYEAMVQDRAALERLVMMVKPAQPEPTVAEMRRDFEMGRALRMEEILAARQERPRLTRPAGNPTFYELLAQAYREYATDGRRPAAQIAEEAGVPVTTAHRWVREARRRGHLPAGKQGRAG